MLREIGGTNCELRYTVNSMCAVEERAGRPIAALLDYEYTAARLLFWGGLLDTRPEITLTGAGELIGAHLRRGGTREEVIDFCAEAMREAGFFGPEDPAAPKKAEKPVVVCAGSTRP